jgi:hypothetical protein
LANARIEKTDVDDYITLTCCAFTLANEKNLENNTAKYGRAFTPNTYTTARGVYKTRVACYETDPLGSPIPLYETYLDYTATVPKGFKDSHSIGNYGWIFDGTLHGMLAKKPFKSYILVKSKSRN